MKFYGKEKGIEIYYKMEAEGKVPKSKSSKKNKKK